MRPICHNREMSCQKTGALVKVTENVYRSGDVFLCRTCGRTVVTDLGDDFVASRAMEVTGLAADLTGPSDLNMAPEDAVASFINFLHTQSEFDKHVMLKHVQKAVGLGQLQSPGSSED